VISSLNLRAVGQVYKFINLYIHKCIIGIKFYDDEKDDLLLADGQRLKNARDFIESLSKYSLMDNWYNSHAEELGYSEASSLMPYRLVAAVMYFEPLNNTVEEIMGQD